MTDNSTVQKLIKEPEGTTAVYAKRQHATRDQTCDGCHETVNRDSEYVRAQYVTQQPGENLRSRRQAREVDYRRRVVLRFHPDCLPSQIALDIR